MEMPGIPVRIGKVSSVNTEKRLARVIFEEYGNIVSGELIVLQHFGAGINISKAGEHTHTITDTYSGGGSADNEGNHLHEVSMGYWMPQIGQQVLCLYLPVFNGDGFILGGL